LIIRKRNRLSGLPEGDTVRTVSVKNKFAKNKGVAENYEGIKMSENTENNASNIGNDGNGLDESVSGVQYGNQIPYDVGVPVPEVQYENRTPYDSGVQYENRVPYDSRVQYENRVPYNSGVQYENRTPYGNQIPYDVGVQYENRVQYDNRAPYDNQNQIPYTPGGQYGSRIPYDVGVPVPGGQYENRSRLSYAEVFALSVFLNKSARIMFLCVATFITLCGIFLAATSGLDGDGIGSGIMFFLLGICFFLFALFHNKIAVAKGVKKIEASSGIIGDDTYVYFSFGETRFRDRTTVRGVQISEKILEYYFIHKIIEDKDYLYIYLALNQAMVLDKKGMLNCEFEQLKAFLMQKMQENGKPFKDYNKKK
jgi:hypothetical protein